jgi:hypothetical protein
MTPKELLQRIENQKAEKAALKALWEILFPDFPVPADRQFQSWLDIPYTFDTVIQGLQKTQIFMNKRIATQREANEAPAEGKSAAWIWNKPLASVTPDDICSFASGCMKKIKYPEKYPDWKEFKNGRK